MTGHAEVHDKKNPTLYTLRRMLLMMTRDAPTFLPVVTSPKVLPAAKVISTSIYVLTRSQPHGVLSLLRTTPKPTVTDGRVH